MQRSTRACFVVVSPLLSLNVMASNEIALEHTTHYISEGRNNLVDGGINWLSGSFDVDANISLSAAYGLATGSGVNYDELNLGIAYAFSNGDFDYHIGYTRLEFFKDDEYDNEIDFALTWNGLEAFTPTIALVYSTEASGSFLQMGGEKQWYLKEDLILSAYAIVAFDFAYASEEHHGYNNTSLGVNLSYVLEENVTLAAFIQQEIAGRDIEQDLGRKENHTWGGVKLSISF